MSTASNLISTARSLAPSADYLGTLLTMDDPDCMVVSMGGKIIFENFKPARDCNISSLQDYYSKDGLAYISRTMMFGSSSRIGKQAEVWNPENGYVDGTLEVKFMYINSERIATFPIDGSTWNNKKPEEGDLYVVDSQCGQFRIQLYVHHLYRFNGEIEIKSITIGKIN